MKAYRGYVRDTWENAYRIARLLKRYPGGANVAGLVLAEVCRQPFILVRTVEGSKLSGRKLAGME